MTLMNYEQTKRYIDMLIYQSELNEEKAGSNADSVASKIEMLKNDIFVNQKLRELVEKESHHLCIGEPGCIRCFVLSLLFEAKK